MEKVCIWCLKNESGTSFLNAAHIFPKSLGGRRLCFNVCDSCNHYFGSKESKLPSVEIALKEPLNISKAFILSNSQKNSKIPRFKSEYFDYDFNKQVLKTKFKYRLLNDFQTGFTRQFKRGIFKVFLEERSESVGDALNSQFDFIREFARRGIGDYPVFYCCPALPVVAVSDEDIRNPVIRFTPDSEELMKQYGFYSYYFITHSIAIPVIRSYEITLSNYKSYMLKDNSKLYSSMVPLVYITDLDFLFSFAFKH